MGRGGGKAEEKARLLENKLFIQRRITLIRSTLSSMPIYLIFLMRMPKYVVIRLEKTQRDFLWGGGALDKRPHLVSWKVVCTYKRKGGLGVKSLVILNRALLGKWL